MSRIPSLVWIGALVLTLANTAIAQESALPESPEIDARVADRLLGTVRRVRVETARMILKDGKWIEGPRRPIALTTYSWHGTRVDVVNYPVEANHHSGREQLVYDAKGNVVEMTVRGADGALLSREVYQYEFDELGNWKKMTRSIAVYENGAVGYEPVDVTYRTITYYFDQRVAKLTADGAPSRPVAAIKPVSRKASATEKPVPPVPLVKAKNFSEKNEGAHEVDGSVSAAATPRQTLSNVAANNVRLAPPSLPVVAVPEEVLRRSAIELPQPEYPTEAERAGIQGRVELQVLISESGEVTAVNPISGHPILTAVAIPAAQKARFSVNNLTAEPAKLFGVLTYNFPPGTNVRSADVSTARVDEVPSEKAATPLAVVPSMSPTVDTVTLSAASRDISGTFERGLASLATANYEAAADSFRRVIERDPKDAIAHTKLGLAYSIMNKHKEAIDAYKQAIRLQRAFVTLDSYYRLGNAHLSLDQYTSAISPLRQSLYMLRAQELNPGPQKADPGPSEADIRYALGLAYYGSESFRSAVKEFERAVRLRPGFISAHYGLGLSYIGVGDNRAAQKQEEVLKRLKSPLANKLTDQLLTPGVRRNKVF